MRITPACAGNTVIVLPYNKCTQDHPRLRGEYCLTAMQNRIPPGSPPLARGIPRSMGMHGRDRGITPACAGNTSSQRGSIKSLSGSPPLARGILYIFSGCSRQSGITPACAGNTWMQLCDWIKQRDHPRLRGEYTKKIPYLQPFPTFYL